MESLLRKALPAHIHIRLSDDASGATPLEFPTRRMWPFGLILGAMFAIFAGVGWMTVGRIWSSTIRDVFDLMFVLFHVFWLIGWSVGVAILGVLTVLVFFYGESARLQGGRLVHVPRLGPIKIVIEYDLARVRNLHLENAGSSDTVKIRFDYDGGSNGFGDTMPRADAERLVRTIRNAAGSLVDTPTPAPVQEAPRPKSPAAAPETADVPPPSITSPSGLALIAANLVPLAGVLFFGWDLASVIVLFWAESAVIGFYTLLKMAVVGRWLAIFAGVFFAGHFGGFMSIHFFFIYEMFVRPLDASAREPGAYEALTRLFTPLWPALLALFLSHGFSFGLNFLARREYRSATIASLMVAPYRRVTLMQVSLIFGGWLVMALNNPLPALALLIALKVVTDLYAHRGERGR